MSDDLWPRLLAAGVQWREGMANARGNRVLWVDAVAAWTDGTPEGVLDRHGRIRADEVPDLTDPATLGCLLAEVERISGGPVTLAGGGLRSGASVVIDYPDGAESYHYPGDLGEDLPDTAARALLAALAALVGVTP